MWNWLKLPIKRAQQLATAQSNRLPALLADLDNEHTPWWGTFIIEEDQSHFWNIAKHIICLDRYNHEWHITHYADHPVDNDVAKTKPNMKTFASYGTHKSINLSPTLPDRTLLCQLERPLYIPAGEEILIYVSTPAWIKVEIGKQDIVLDEIATHVLSDTWCGKNTLEGELCYASRNHCSSRLEELPHGTTQVLTPITVINRSKTFLLLKAVRLPLPCLSIFSDGFNYLWTEQLSMCYEHDEYPQSTIIKGPHKALKDLTLLTTPRVGISSGVSFKKFLNSFTAFTRNK